MQLFSCGIAESRHAWQIGLAKDLRIIALSGPIGWVNTSVHFDGNAADSSVMGESKETQKGLGMTVVVWYDKDTRVYFAITFILY